jgi:hypothetical protein
MIWIWADAMRETTEDVRDLDRGFYLSREAQVGELRRLYALELEDAARLSAAISSSEQVTDAPQ